MKGKTQKNKKDKLEGLYFLLIIVILIWLASILILPKYYPIIEDRAFFGDSFGTINSLFSGLAFAGIIYTILLQRKELALQREELKETRKELIRSATAQEKSEKQQRRQSENLKITAKLNALHSLLNYYVVQEEYAQNKGFGEIKKNQLEQQKYVEQIKEILKIREI